MQASVTHFLLTRYNVPSPLHPGRGAALVLDPTWLDERTTLFERICAPSVRAQTDDRFEWLIGVDERTPAPIKERIAQAAPRARVVVAADSGGPTAAALIDGHGSDWVATTRLDNDDALARDAIARIRAATRDVREVLNLPNGYHVTLSDGRVRRTRQPSNPFLTLVEPAGDPLTAWGFPHRRAAEHAPVRQLDDAPGWLQVVHGSNLRNRRINGPPVSRRDVVAACQIDASLIAPTNLRTTIEGHVRYWPRRAVVRARRAIALSKPAVRTQRGDADHGDDGTE